MAGELYQVARRLERGPRLERRSTADRSEQLWPAALGCSQPVFELGLPANAIEEMVADVPVRMAFRLPVFDSQRTGAGDWQRERGAISRFPGVGPARRTSIRIARSAVGLADGREQHHGPSQPGFRE